MWEDLIKKGHIVIYEKDTREGHVCKKANGGFEVVLGQY